MCDWNLDDKEKYFKLFIAQISSAYTWGNDSDEERRATIRQESLKVCPNRDEIQEVKWWAFRIFVEKGGNDWDVDNIPKLVVDAFSRKLIDDDSEFPGVTLYDDDTVEFVRMVQVAGKQSKHQDRTVIEVFGAR